MLADFEYDYRKHEDYIKRVAKESEGCSPEYTAWRAVIPVLCYLKTYDRKLYENCMTYIEEEVKDVIL